MGRPHRGAGAGARRSSANLGPGFDSLGPRARPLRRGRGVASRPTASPSRSTGEGAGQVPCDERAPRRAGDAHARFGPSSATRRRASRMRCRNAIPHSRGLGSSAAAAVGRRGGRGRARRPRRRSWNATRCCRSPRVWRATPTTRRPACSAGSSWPGRRPGIPRSGSTLYGSTCTRTSVRSRSSRGPSRSTSTTRGLLPERVPLADAAFTGSRTALAVLAFTQRPELLMPATEDRLHQGYRRPAYPESADLVDALRAHGRAGRHLRRRTDRAGADHGRRVLPAARPARLHRRCRCRSTPRASWSRST